MGSIANMECRKMDEFNRRWAKLFADFPDSKKAAVAEMGKAMQEEVNAQIQASDLRSGAKATVCSWQELRLGSKGGYAAVSAKSGNAPPKGKEKQHTWNGEPVTMRKVTRWLEKGRGTAAPSYNWHERFWAEDGSTKLKMNWQTGKLFVPARQFYARAKNRKFDRAMKAAEDLMQKLSKELTG